MRNLDRIYLAATGDLIRSKTASQEQMETLQSTTKKINRLHKPIVAFSLQSGDEIQGLLSLDSKPISVLMDFCGAIFPLTIRWGIGIGFISTPILSTTAEMRGTAFEFSRKALNNIKKKRYRFSLNSGGDNEQLINLIFRLVSGYLGRWNNKTYRRYKLYTRYETIYKVAEIEDVSIEAINKYIIRQGIREIMESLRFVDKFLEEYQPYRVDK